MKVKCEIHGLKSIATLSHDEMLSQPGIYRLVSGRPADRFVVATIDVGHGRTSLYVDQDGKVQTMSPTAWKLERFTQASETELTLKFS